MLTGKGKDKTKGGKGKADDKSLQEKSKVKPKRLGVTSASI